MKRQLLLPTLGAALAVCGALVSACSGGGGGGTQSPLAATTTSATGTPSAANNPTPGPNTAAVKISIVLPTPPASAAPSSQKRSPAYVSPATDYVYLTTTPSSGSYYIYCTSGNCTGTVNIPVTSTNLTATLYNYYGQALSQATQAISITKGTANTITFTFNGVVASFQITSSTPTLVIGVPTSVPITVTPLDASGYPIVAASGNPTVPGDVIASDGSIVIAGLNGSPQTVSLTSSYPSVLTPPATLTWNGPGSYTLTGTATYNGGDPGTSPDQVVLSASSTVTTVTGTEIVSVQPKSIFMTATSSYTIPTVAGFPEYSVITRAASASGTLTSVEFPILNASLVPVYLTVTSNFNDAGSALTLSGDTCSNNYSTYGADNGINQAFPTPGPGPSGTPIPAATMGPSGYAFSFNAAATTNGQCHFRITDGNGYLVDTDLGFESSQITVEGKARK